MTPCYWTRNLLVPCMHVCIHEYNKYACMSTWIWICKCHTLCICNFYPNPPWLLEGLDSKPFFGSRIQYLDNGNLWMSKHCNLLTTTNMGVNPKIMVFSPQIIHLFIGVHYFHHPFWVFSPYFWKHPHVVKISGWTQWAAYPPWN